MSLAPCLLQRMQPRLKRAATGVTLGLGSILPRRAQQSGVVVEARLSPPEVNKLKAVRPATSR